MSPTPDSPILFKDEANFNSLLSRSGIYVDKTAYLAQILRGNSHIVLARPRRFGKSLFLSTAAEYLSGNRTLFKDLAIYKSPPKVDESYNVIHIDMLKIGDFETVAEFRKRLFYLLHLLAKSLNLQIPIEEVSSPALFLATLVNKLYRRNGKKIVLLIDEYDYPFHRFQASSFQEIKDLADELADFYVYTKHNNTPLAYSFFTGILRLSQLSIQTQTRHITDIDLEPNMDAICGYTQEEIQHYYSKEVEELSRVLGASVEDTYLRIKDNYSGYHFNRLSGHKISVYNPCSVICALHQQQFSFEWAAAGIPPLFLFVLKENLQEELTALNKSGNKPIGVPASFFDPTPLNEVSLVHVLFETGYLTFSSNSSDLMGYVLQFPNQEVMSAFYRMVVRRYTKIDEQNYGISNPKLSDTSRRILYLLANKPIDW